MKVSKAIEILRFDLHHPRTCAESDTDEAIKLAINALGFYRKLNKANMGEIQGNFLGETPEDE